MKTGAQLQTAIAELDTILDECEIIHKDDDGENDGDRIRSELYDLLEEMRFFIARYGDPDPRRKMYPSRREE